MLKKTFYFILLLVVALSLTACNKAKQEIVKDYQYSFTDALGREVNLTEKPLKTVALLGSFGEAWQLAGGTLAGITSDGASERNMELEDVSVVGTVKEPSVEAMLELEPDFVILSADIESHKKISKTLDNVGIANAFFKVETFEDYVACLKIFTDITGESELYQRNGTSLQTEIQGYIEQAKDKPKPKVLFIRAFSTGAKAKGADNMTGKMLADLGAVNLVDQHESLLENISMEAVIEADPDYIFVTTMGEQEAALANFKTTVESSPAWAGLRAVSSGNFIVLPRELFHYKPNARWAEAYKYLYEALYE